MPHQTVIRNLSNAHRNMERVLTLLRLQADSLRDGDDPTQLTLLGNSVIYMRNYPGVNHHPTEDFILDKMRNFARPLCDGMSSQHHGFGRQEDELLRAVRDVQGGHRAACKRVRDLATAYCADSITHIHDEEEKLFPLAVQRLSALDWHEIEARSRDMTDADVERNQLKSYDNLYERLMSLNKQAVTA